MLHASMIKVAPAKRHSDTVAAPTSFFLRRRQAPQQWEVVTVADHSSRSKHLRACLGFSKTAAPWWDRSILWDENAMFMTRDAWCDGTANPKVLAERRAERRARLTEIGQSVEVLVENQRDWYAGKVIRNDLAGACDGKSANMLLAVKFSNGSVLRNVRPKELRPVPRITLAGWAIAALIWAVCVRGIILNGLATVHSTQHGDFWFARDRAFKKLPNTTLYNLTYHEVAAAYAHPETWLHVTLEGAFDKWRYLPIGGHNSSWFLKAESSVLGYQVGRVALLPPIFAALGGCAQLRRVPTFLQVTIVLCAAAAEASQLTYLFFTESDHRQSEEYFFSAGFERTPTNLVATIIVYAMFWSVIWSCVNWFLLPVFASFLRQEGKALAVSRIWLGLFLAFSTYWFFVGMRYFHFQNLLDDVIATDDNLERLAGSIMFLNSSMCYLDFRLYGVVLCTVLLYSTLNRKLTTVNQMAIIFNILLLLPATVCQWALFHPLPVATPVNWELLQKRLPINLTANYWLTFCFYGSLGVSVLQPIIGPIVAEVITAQRVRTLNKRVRNGLLIWVFGKSKSMLSFRSLKEYDTTTRTTMRIGDDDYQPLNLRPPSRKVIRPISSVLETYLMTPGKRLKHRKWVPLPLSTVMHVRCVLEVTGMALAGYMAEVVAGVHVGKRKPLRQTLVEVLTDLQSSEKDREFVLQLADRGRESEYPASTSTTHSRTKNTIENLREVVLRLGTKHRDHIYLRRMEGVGRETGFQQFIDTADQVQALAMMQLRGVVLRQSVIAEGMPWAAGVSRLLDSACGVNDRYDAFMATLAVKSGGEFHKAPLKGLFRLSEKVWLRPTKNPDPQKTFFPRGDCANVFDVVRGMLVCANIDALNICLGLLVSCDVALSREIAGNDVAAAEAAGMMEKINVLRVKNRFRQPTSSGWADVLINFTFASDPDQHICEVQLVHEGMLTARKHCNAHNAYAKFRSALELLETFGLASVPARENNALGDASLKLENTCGIASIESRRGNALGDVDMAHREFVQSIEDGYEDFLARYREAVGISAVSETDAGANESKKSDGVIVNLKNVQSSHVTATSLEELQGELVRLQEARQQDKAEYQRKLDLVDKKHQQQLDLADQKQRTLERQIDLLDKKFQQHLEQMRSR